jgi:hypothetical protein
MATDLTSIKARLTVMLVDAGSVNFPSGLLDESIRLALAEYNLVLNLAGQTLATLSGLDGAVTTTLPAAHEGILLTGAAGYAVEARALDRAESYDLGQSVPQQLLDWSQLRLAEFRKMVSQYRADLTRDAEMARKTGLHTAASAPYPSSTDPDYRPASWSIDSQDGEFP